MCINFLLLGQRNEGIRSVGSGSHWIFAEAFRISILDISCHAVDCIHPLNVFCPRICARYPWISASSFKELLVGRRTWSLILVRYLKYSDIQMLDRFFLQPLSLCTTMIHLPSQPVFILPELAPYHHLEILGPLPLICLVYLPARIIETDAYAPRPQDFLPAPIFTFPVPRPKLPP